MPRLRQVALDEVQDTHIAETYQRLFEGRDPVSQPGTATGSRGDWWTTYALVPDLFRFVTDGIAFHSSSLRRVDLGIRELCETRAGWARGSKFVFSQHSKFARAAGVSDEKVAQIPSWEVATCYSPIERAALAYTDALVQDGGRVPDGTFAALREHLDDEQILELTFVTCWYEMHSTICRALRVEFDDMDDAVVEVAAPEAN